MGVNRRSVHIEKLRIRIPRALAGQAKSIARGVGTEILRGIAEHTASESGGGRVDALEAVLAGGAPDARTLQQQLRKRGAGHG